MSIGKISQYISAQFSGASASSQKSEEVKTEESKTEVKAAESQAVTLSNDFNPTEALDRQARIDGLKKSVSQGSYQIDSEKLAAKVAGELFA